MSDRWAPWTTWWLAFALVSGIPLWVGFGGSPGWLLAVHGAAAALALLGTIVHALGASGSLRGWIAAGVLAIAFASGFWASTAPTALGHVGASLLLAVATYVHVAGRAARRVWGTKMQAVTAVAIALIGSLLWRIA